MTDPTPPLLTDSGSAEPKGEERQKHSTSAQSKPARHRSRQNGFFRKHYVGITTSAELLVDILSISASFLVGYSIYPLIHNRVDPRTDIYLKLGFVAIVGGILIFERMGLYKKQMSLMNVDEIRKIFRSVFLLALLLFAYSFYVKIDHSRMILTYSIIIMLVLVFCERMLFYKLHQIFHLRGANLHRTIICGAGEVGRLLYQRICQSPKLGYQAVGFFDEDRSLLDGTQAWLRRDPPNNPLFMWRKEDLVSAIESLEVDEILIAWPSRTPERLREIIDLCQQMDIKFSYIPYLHGYFVEQVHVKDFDGIPLIVADKIRISKADEITKRLFDLTMSLFFLLILAPVFLVVAIAIRSNTVGPVFFKQTRVGRNGKRFEIYKFRTMHSESPAYMNSPKSREDHRITGVGRILRRTSLDELPQLINVLKGEMSLVGPRPEMPFIADTYNELQRERLRVKPGITGLWQISADRERAIHENISYDIYYIENRSLLLDIAILFRTIVSAIFSMKTH
jgi:exopolysaccharide biosynthesis polyprenyl glycosylphosphotransferase